MSTPGAAAVADPNGWVKSPPSTFVTVHGTSRASMNGRRGLVLTYDASKARYLILLLVDPQQQVSLKNDNLQKVTSLVDTARSYVELFQSSPELHRQWQRFITVVQYRTNHRVPPQYLLLGLAVAMIGLCFVLGLAKTIMVFSCCVLLLTVCGEDVMNTNMDARAIVRNAPYRWKNCIRENIPKFGPMIADHNLYLYAFTGLVAFLTIAPLFTSGGGSKRGGGGKSTTKSPAPFTGGGGDDDTAGAIVSPEHYYKLGYDDAKSNLDFGASLAEAIAAATASAVTRRRSLVDDHDDDDQEWLPPNNKSSSSQLFSISTALAVFAIVRTVYPLGQDGTTGKWNYQLAYANVQTLPTWRMALLGFALYRIVAAALS